jgi:hypothetical protein
MMPGLVEALLWPTISGIVVGVTVHVLTKRSVEKAIRKAAIERFVSELDRLITKANLPNQDRYVLARSIVSTRDGLKKSLSRMNELLNSEIDRLSGEVTRLDRVRGSQAAEAEILGAVNRTLGVLQEKWPAKKIQIEIELDKLHAELGTFGKRPPVQA